MPQLSCWSLIQVRHGTGYYLQSQTSQDLEAGMVLLVAGHQPGNIRASQLGGLSLCAFSVIPARLTGLMTMGEQDFLEQAASQKDFSLRILPPHNPVAVKMKELCNGRNPDGLMFRLNLLQLFVEAFGGELQQAASHWETVDAKERLQLLLQRTPLAELLEMSFDELALMTHCTSRHLGRTFYDVVGMSFREKRTEIRLALARELLATSNIKVIEVALKSGYKSLSLFNLMFTRRFGTSPGKWRQKHTNAKNGESEINQKRRHADPRPVGKGARTVRMNPPSSSTFLVGSRR